VSRQDIPEELVAYDRMIEMVEASVLEILRHEDGERYLDWMRANAARFFGDVPVIDEEQRAAMAVALGRGVWNAVPLPGNQFRPRPMPEPGRNDPCPCGSGRKYKQCCADLPHMEDLSQEEIWPILVHHLPRQQLEQAVRSHRLPAAALAQLAMQLVEDGEAKRAAELLKPLFDGPVDRLDQRFEHALDVLCDAYLELGRERERWALVERVAAQARGALQRAAWQRIAVMKRDTGDIPAAWEAFRQAQQADPGEASLALTEVLLLVTEQRTAEASARAKFWATRLRKERYPDDELIAKLESLARDPAGAMADIFSQSIGVDLAPLRAWVARVGARALPQYRTGPLPVIDPSDPEGFQRAVTEHFAAMGMAPDQVEDLARQLGRDLQKQARAAERQARKRGASSSSHGLGATSERELQLHDGAGGGRPPDGPERLLRAPEALAPIEAAWHQVFPCSKPISTNRELEGDEDPWFDQAADDWLAFLDRRPEAADSLDILDDLVTALMPVEGDFPQGTQGGLALQLAQRGLCIVEAAVAGEPVELPWTAPQNRPGLRLIARCIEMSLNHGENGAAVALAELLLRLNPSDNHGFRGMLVTHRLRSGEDAAALELIQRYPDDATVELRCGEVLVRLKQGDTAAAHASLLLAHRCNPHVPGFLTRAEVKQRRSPDGWISWGSPEEAWEYRVQARDVWAAVPGALEWLSEAARGLPKEPARGASSRRAQQRRKGHKPKRA